MVHLGAKSPIDEDQKRSGRGRKYLQDKLIRVKGKNKIEFTCDGG